MKKSYLNPLLVLLFAFQMLGAQNPLEQALPTEEGKVVFVQVNELSDKETELHAEAVKHWFSMNDFPYKQREENDLSRDLIEGRGSIKALWGPNNFEAYLKTLKFRIEIIVKKDRYQYRFYDFIVVDGSQEAQLEIFRTDTRLGARYNPGFYQKVEQKMNLLIEELDQRLNHDMMQSGHSIGKEIQATNPTSAGSQGNGKG